MATQMQPWTQPAYTTQWTQSPYQNVNGGAAGLTGSGQSSTAPTWYGTGQQWSTDKSGAPMQSNIQVPSWYSQQYGTGQMQPSQQYTTGQMQPGQYSTGQMQPGQYSTGQMQPGQYSTGQMQPGQYSTGQQAPADWYQMAPSTQGPTPPGDWTYNVPQGGLQQGAAQAPPTQFTPMQGGTDWDWYKKNQEQMATYLPYAQFMQNAQQYGMDFNEAQRRWNEQFTWTQQTDAYNMNMAGRQQTMAEWQAQQAANQWNQQFGWTQQTDQFNMGLAQQTQDWTQQYQGGQLDIQRQQNQIEQMWREGQLTNQQREIALGELTQQQQNAYQYAQLNQQAGLQGRELDIKDWGQRQQAGLQGRELDIKDWYQRQQTDVARGQMQIDAMWRSGQLTNEQRQLALAELTQGQRYALESAQFGWQQQYQQQQMQQEAALSRERMANEQRMAAMQAYGRAYAPNVRAIRSWA